MSINCNSDGNSISTQPTIVVGTNSSLQSSQPSTPIEGTSTSISSPIIVAETDSPIGVCGKRKHTSVVWEHFEGK